MADIDLTQCRITSYPAEVLRQVAKPIDKIDDNVRKLAEKMTDIMIEYNGIGLAGPQANVSLRIFVISLDGSKEGIKVYINPTVKPAGEMETMEEGCLSVSGVYTKIKRYVKCTVTATDLDGKEFTEEADGLYARCLQHEYDHLEGFTIANKMSSAAKIA
ncbi:MAG TPA: peptide deformylase, partial [Sedimentisphaerales bacterium]|nr:peptide deformylase [Sedimentisphaerales bacterium]